MADGLGFGGGLFGRRDPLVYDDGSIVALTDSEFAGKNRTIVANGAARTTAGGSTVYTVASGKVLFVIMAGISYYNENSGNDLGGAGIDIGSEIILDVVLPRADSATAPERSPHQTVVTTLTSPLKVVAGGTVVMGMDTGSGRATGWFVGWLEDV